MSFKPKILLIRQLALGDVLLITPILKQIYVDHAGDCEIDVLTMKPEAFVNNPYVTLIISPTQYLENRINYHKTINLDLAYECHPDMHILDAYAKYSHGSIEKILDRQIGIFPSQSDTNNILQFINLTIAKDYLVIHMRRDTWPSRNLPEATWLAIVDSLLEGTDLHIVQVGSAHEISFNHSPRLINCLSKLSLTELKVLIENAKCYVGIDSGTLHVAASTQTPIVSVFTSAHHQFREPLGRKEGAKFIPIAPDLPCYGCQSRLPPPITGVICSVGDPYSPPCKDRISVTEITNAVVKAID